MQKTKTILMSTLWGMISAAVAIIIAYEAEIIQPGTLAHDKRTEYICAVVMELLALGSIPLALRLFKWRKISNELTRRKEQALLKWGMLRMMMISVPIIVNLIFYYMFLNPTFVYLALIHAICLMFVYPTIDRCVAETSDQT